MRSLFLRCIYTFFRKIREALSLDKDFYWVGIHFSQEEEKWRWPNGDLGLTTDHSLWAIYYNGGEWKCVVIIYLRLYSHLEISYIIDQPCLNYYPAICEKHV